MATAESLASVLTTPGSGDAHLIDTSSLTDKTIGVLICTDRESRAWWHSWFNRNHPTLPTSSATLLLRAWRPEVRVHIVKCYECGKTFDVCNPANHGVGPEVLYDSRGPFYVCPHCGDDYTEPGDELTVHIERDHNAILFGKYLACYSKPNYRKKASTLPLPPADPEHWVPAVYYVSAPDKKSVAFDDLWPRVAEQINQ